MSLEKLQQLLHEALKNGESEEMNVEKMMNWLSQELHQVYQEN
ncbi:hypothetical protein [Mangrovibacillus cuniculi]|nr:hypothetical protein [Mangrovibacillus cuniculi]